MIKTLYQTSYFAVVPMLLGSILFAYLPPFKWNHELFHVLLEGGGSLVAFILALFITSQIIKERLEMNYVWLIACFIAMGILDLVHSQIPPGQIFVWLHSCATFIGGFFAALIWLPASISKKFFSKWYLFAIIVLSISFSVGSIALPEMTLVMLDNNKAFTVSAKVLNFAGGVGFIVAWGYFAKIYHLKHHPESFYFSNQFCLFGIAGLLFEVSVLWDGNWWLWHILRAFAFILLAIYFAQMYWRDIVALTQLNRDLNKKTVELEIAEHYTRSLFETSLDPLITISPEGLITDVNNATEQKTGHDRNELMGTDFSNYFTDPAQAKIIYEEVFENKRIRDHLLELKHKDGTVKSVSYNASLYTDLNGNVVGVFAAARDITKQIEAQRSKSEFLANMSHELRTPMHSILSFSQLGLKKIESADKEKLLKYFNRIETSGERLLVLLNDLLDLSKLESGRMDLELKTANLQLTLESCLNEQESQIADQKLRITTSFDRDCIGTFDTVRINQVITNLLSNAIKFTPDGKSISITITTDKLADRPTLCFSIEDEGIGIPEGELEEVFDKFIQSSKTKTSAGGTGLGLSICKEIISSHHGKIWAKHGAHGGTIFKFTIPLDR
jgi:PAS domain S-box-containing protein